MNASSKSQPKPLTMGLGLFNSQFTNQFGGIKQPEVNPSCPNLNFLKDEVKHLRTQLDLLSKHMIHVPTLPKQQQIADDESSISYTNRTPVETPNINEQESVSRCLDDAEDYSTAKDLNYNDINVNNFQSNKVALEAEVTDTDDCAEEAPYQNNRRNEESKAEALSRNTARKMPSQHLSSNASVRDRSNIDNRLNKLPMPQIPRLPIPRNTSSSHYTPIVFEDKRLSEFQVQASKSSKSNLNNLTVRNPARASFGPQTKFDVSSTTKGNKLAFLLDPKQQTRTKSSHETSVSAVPNKKPYTGQPKQKISQPLNKLTSTVQSRLENVETDEGAANRPLNVLNSLNQINKDISVKTQMNFGDKHSSTTEHESCMQDTPNMDTVVVTEAVLVETPISKHKPVKVSDATALPGSFTDRQYSQHYFFRDSVRQETSTVQPNTDDIIQEESSPLLQLESNPGVLSEEREAYSKHSKHAQSILISESQANSNALGLVRRQAASRMSDRYGMGVNFNNLMKDDDTRLSIRTFPKVAVEKHTARNQNEPRSPVSTNQMSPRLVASQQQLIIMLGEDQSDIVMDTQRQESTISSNQAGPKKLHQTTVFDPATFSASANEKSKREVGRSHNFQPSPSKMLAKRKPTNMQKQTSSGQSYMGGRHRPSQQLPPKNCRNGLNQLIAPKTKRTQVSKQQQSTSAQSQPQALIQHPGPKKKSKPQLQIQDQADQHRQVITIQLNEVVASNKTTEPKPSSHINVASSRSTVTSVHNFNNSATTEHRNSILKSSAATQESRRNHISASTQVQSK